MKKKGKIAWLPAVMLLAGTLLGGCGQSRPQPLLRVETAASAAAAAAENTEAVAETQSVRMESGETHVVYNGNGNWFGTKRGCAVIADISEDYYNNYYSYYSNNFWKEQAAPDSTFKIISALIGLEEGIITSADSRMGYDGSDYGRSEWNRDLTLREAFETSCVWYFRKIMDETGQEKVLEYLKALSYGNCNVSSWEGSDENRIHELNGFWLESSLLISPREQVDVLKKILRGGSPFQGANVNILKDIMLAEEEEFSKLYGKTGGDAAGTNAWYTGFYETQGHTYCFAVRLAGTEKNRVSGGTARAIAEKLLEQYREIPFQKIAREVLLMEDGSSISGTIQDGDFERLSQEAEAVETTEGVFGGTPCEWITITGGGRQYFFVRLMIQGEGLSDAPMLINAAVTDDGIQMKCGIHTGMTAEEAREIFPYLYEYSFRREGNLPKNIVKWNTGSFPDEWCLQYESVLMAQISYGEELPWYLGLLLDENGVVRAITSCYPTAG